MTHIIYPQHACTRHRPTHDDSTRINTHPTSSQCVSRVTNARFEHARGAVRPPACERAAARLLVRQERVVGRCRRVGGRGGRDAGQHELRGSLSPRAVARSGVWSGTVACTARSRSAGQTPAGPAAASERLRERSATRVSTRERTCWAAGALSPSDAPRARLCRCRRCCIRVGEARVAIEGCGMRGRVVDAL